MATKMSYEFVLIHFKNNNIQHLILNDSLSVFDKCLQVVPTENNENGCWDDWGYLSDSSNFQFGEYRLLKITFKGYSLCDY